MPARDVARRHYRDRQRIVDGVTREGRRLWREVDLDALETSWSRRAARLLVVLAGAQLLAASRADDYVDAVLGEQGVGAAPAGAVVPGALAGIASDGRTLEGLLRSPVVSTARALARGESRSRALASGQATLDMTLATQVADAGRVADGIAVAARPGVGYVRMLQPPSCSRCVVLAGRFYRYNQGFQRHPRCDCLHIPASEAMSDDLAVNPQTYFDSLSEEEQDRAFTKAGAQAIRDGADINQVVNARRGMTTAVGPSGRRRLVTEEVFGRDVFVTREGITRRGLAGQRLAGRSRGVRLMPEQIYRDATSRDDAVRLLRLHGYIR